MHRGRADIEWRLHTARWQGRDLPLSERWIVAAVTAITLAGLALRLPSFGDLLFRDSPSAYYIVAGHSLGQVMRLLNNHPTELNPPLFFVFAWISEKLFGASAESLKLVSLLA